MDEQKDMIIENLIATLGSLAPTWKVRGSGKLTVLNHEGKAVGFVHLDEIPRIESLPAAVDPDKI